MKIKELIKKKMVVGGLCMIAAFVLAFVLIPSNNKKDNEEVDIVKVNKTIVSNTQITDQMLKTEKVSRNLVPNGAITDKTQITGKFSTCTIYPIDFLTDEKISQITTDSNLYNLSGDEVAISILTDNIAASVSGKLIPGDIVGVLGYNKEQKNVIEHADLKYLQVLAVSNSQGVSIEQARSENTGSSEAVVPATVTLRVNSEQAKKLVDIQNTGSVHCTLVGRGDTATALIENIQNGGNDNG